MAATSIDKSDFSINDPGIYKVQGCSQPISVKVSDYNYGNINPSPIKLPKDTELLEEFLSPRKLQALTGVDNLETVEFLEMRVNTDQMSLGNFGMYLPNLTQIKLSGSYIPTIRDLGTSLWNLQVLWMPQCCLQCLDGLVTMSNIKELYLAYNEIEDISSCGMLENLEILDLEGNHIEDSSNLHYLSMCPKLSRMTLDGNPLCNPHNYEAPMTYRSSVAEAVPQLEFLDDISVDSYCKNEAAGDNISLGSIAEVVAPNATLELEEHWKFINSMLLESGLLAESSRIKEMSPRTPDYDSGRPSSSSVTSARPRSAMRPMSAQRQVVNSTSGRPGTATIQRPASAISQDSCNNESLDEPEIYDDSSLTAGRVVCGSITKSLRRQSEQQSSNSPRIKAIHELRPKTCQMTGTSEKLHNFDMSVFESCNLVLHELSEWRHDYEKSRSRIEKQKAAQTLTIDCTDEEIEIIIPNKQMPTGQGSQDQANEEKMNKKLKSDIKLNPIRNGKLPPQTAPWMPVNEHDKKTMDGNNNLLTLSTTPNCSSATSAVASNQPSQMSRIRRQLFQSGVSSITPSKPLLKR